MMGSMSVLPVCLASIWVEVAELLSGIVDVFIHGLMDSEQMALF